MLLEKYLTEYIHIEEGSKDLLFSSFGTIRSRSAYLPIWFSSLEDAQMLWGPSTHISLTTPGILETWNTRMRDALPLPQKSYFPWGEKPMTRKVFNKQKKQPPPFLLTLSSLRSRYHIQKVMRIRLPPTNHSLPKAISSCKSIRLNYLITFPVPQSRIRKVAGVESKDRRAIGEDPRSFTWRDFSTEKGVIQWVFWKGWRTLGFCIKPVCVHN